MRKIFLAVPFLALLYACQSEVPQEITESTRCLMVKAAFQGSDNTRAQITYGNQDTTKEIFRWTAGDEIFLYNMSQFNEYPVQACFDIQPDFEQSANFKFDNGVGGHAKEFVIKNGDVILAVYGDTERVMKTGSDNKIYPDERNIVRIGVGTEANKPQYIQENPDDSSMSYMKDNLRMYDIVTAVKDDEIPDLHFKHLSAILRVTLQNETDHDIFPSKLEFEYPGTESFFNTNIYCSINQNSSDGSGLKIYDNGEFFGGNLEYRDDKPIYTGGTPVYADTIGSTINGKIGVIDSGGMIKKGDKYDLYISTVPRTNINEGGKNGLDIRLIEEHITSNPYIITISNFNTVIEPGKRYWFHLTAVEEDGKRKLMLTSDWLEKHNNQNTNQGEETTP